MLYRDALTAHQWTPPVPESQQYIKNERQWLLLGDKCAFLHIYIACQNNKNDSYIQWNEDLFQLVTKEAIILRKQGLCCLAMGDFNTRVGSTSGLEGNTPDTNNNYPMFRNFISQVNMTIINTLPIAKGLFTRFMDSSGRPGTKSLLDYGLIDQDHINTVTSFVIDEDARHDAGSDHALLECIIELGARPTVQWCYTEAIHYNLVGNTDYTKYKSTLDTAVSSIPLHDFAKLPVQQMLPHISEKINQSALKTIGLKIRKGKRGRNLPRDVITMIREKNILTRSIDNARLTSSSEQIEILETKLESFKSEIKDALGNLKFKRRSHLRARLLRSDPSRKRFWRFLKQQIKSAGSITASYDKTGKMVFAQDEIEEAVLDNFTTVFKGQRIPVYPTSTTPVPQTDIAIQEMEMLINKDTPSFNPTMYEEQVCPPYSFSELEAELSNLTDGKATGYDHIPNELLKNSGFRFKLYLQTFLNKMLRDGTVPQDLNIGKCMLIHKVKERELKVH